MTSENTETEQKTVRFNVGGQFYEVSKALIEQHEDSMLARLVSDTWLSNPDITIFIDRDGERFKNVLDYMRYGKVSLPITVSRETFLLDMEYYGFTSVDTNNSHSTPELSQIDDSESNKEVILRCVNIFQTKNLALAAMKKSKEKLEESKKRLELEIICFEKAKEYAHLYIGKTSGKSALKVNHQIAGAKGSKEHMKSEQFFSYLQDNMSNDYKMLNSCLAGYGLKAIVFPYNFEYITIDAL
eukprot:CAMPEP_0172424558 /NCGR_PEP_ID=MMETSP1064-20121228/26423_1 /TAXON_ID=202472 /ORGANISM="Aulacoseira subarctica , Strain CCAP 1002/5" /LENGTH=241 /DNA_ID=CAMNT_0013166773 /DNA_START=245 /DNA_END=970 /DNA_ORIENTATION=+